MHGLVDEILILSQQNPLRVQLLTIASNDNTRHSRALLAATPITLYPSSS